MASYVDSTLLPNETVVYRAHVSVWTLFIPLLLGVLLLVVSVVLTYSYWDTIKANTAELAVSLGVAAVGLIFFLVAYLRYRTTEFASLTRLKASMSLRA